MSLLVQCVNRMLEIKLDSYGASEKSSAYRLSIESGDPDFSANLVNQIVEKKIMHLFNFCNLSKTNFLYQILQILNHSILFNLYG